MDLIRKVNSIMEISKTRPEIFKYAFCGENKVFISFLEKLANLAEEEEWSLKKDSTPDILKFYIYDTFDQCKKQNILLEENDHSTFNTGLLTNNGEEIYGIFEKNRKPNQQPWFFKGFVKESDIIIVRNFTNKPKLAQYANNYSDYYFDIEKDIILNVDHILDDNYDRFPDEVKKQGKEILKALFKNAFETSKIKVKRNNRLIIPQLYNDKLSYLMPIKLPLEDENFFTMALAVEKIDGTGNYRANTIFTLEMAYSRARLIMKPESNWLINY